ncbi:MAG: hypothetical protein OER86_04240 [Phycisphaerae bacterium]|nr:hypothetical protein [Phycisphaerae bacterium]
MAESPAPKVLPTPPFPETGEWFVLHIRSRQEKALAADLAARSVGYFMPVVQHVRYYNRRKSTVQLPLFPGYLFLRGSRDEAFEADRTRRVAKIIEVADQDYLHWELANLHLAIGCGAALDPYPYLKEGVRVEVRSGPFQGLQGMVEKRTAPDRLLLQVDILGKGMALEIDGSLLDVIE